MKHRRLLVLAPVVTLALLGLACSQADVHPAPLGDCLDPATCNPPKADASSTKDAAADAKPATDAKVDAPAADAGDAGSDAALDAADAG